MRVSPARVLSLSAAALIAVAAAAHAGKAHPTEIWQFAQAGAPPVKLGPRQIPPAASQPAKPEPAEPPPPPVTGPVPLILPEVEVQTLTEVDPESVGVLDDANGGLGADMWRGSERNAVIRLLGLLPGRVSSPTMRDLMRRLLLTRATAPASAEGTNRRDLPMLRARVDRLSAIGDAEGALRLLRAAAPERAGEPLVRNEVEALFFANDNAGACQAVRAKAQGFQHTYWLQATAYCLALGGERAKAGLVSELLAERGAEVEPAFFAAMDSLTLGRAGDVRSLTDPAALHLSMMRAANLRLPDDVAKSKSPAVLRAVSLSPNADFALRLEAAEGAFVAGALTVEQLLEIYANVPFEPGELSNPLTAAEAAWGPRGRALLMRAASLNDVPAARAEILQSALKLGREKGGLAIVRASAAPLVAAIKPAADLLWFARDATRVLFAANRIEEALGWYSLARQEAANNPAAAEAAVSLWPLAALAGDQEAAGSIEAAFDRWWAAQPKGAESSAHAQRLLALLAASGFVAGPGPWTKAIGLTPRTDVEVPGPAIRQMLARATAERLRGEAVTLALIAFGEEGPAASTLAIEMGMRALHAVGLTKEARAIALEAAVAGGL